LPEKKRQSGRNLFPSGIKPLWSIRNSTCKGFITVLCDYECANLFPERDRSKINRKRADLLKYGKKGDKIEKKKTKRE